ncbi:ABC transporter ATP-binding protein [Lysobacter terrae]
MTVSIKVRGLSLELPYEMQGGAGTAAHGWLATFASAKRRFTTVLKGIDFDASEGDRIGIMGLNGAGKTTLLRVLNGALQPTQGSVERNGSLQSLLSTTLGFNEYATLVENIILRGTAMGLRYRQVDAAVENILEFAGLTDRANHRLHTLSAGQRMRLGFAISTAVQPDILLMDEWIGAGDENFIMRAKERMLNRIHGSRIVVLASHSTELLRELCNKAIVLNDGRMRFFGPVEDAIADYRDVVSRAGAAQRRLAADSDPLLFGEAVGLIERVKHDSKSITLEGWVVDERGGEVDVICVEVDGRHYVFEEFERVEREDVRLHLGKRRGSYGFRVRIVAPMRAQRTANGIRVSAGPAADRLGPPLRLAVGSIVESA